MKGAYLISLDQGFFEEIVAVLSAEGAVCAWGQDPMVQLVDGGGRVLTVFGEYEDRDFLEGPDVVLVPGGEGVVIPDLRAVAVCSVECRWEELFVEVVGRLAGRVSAAMWVVDGKDVVWGAGAIDVERVAL
ncbi:hypothetical protein GCM10009554_68740 [Kribbella koreensis]|uniref:Uncharacterized protein n=1 Tax=Kribbella koreensis TaxID=57909 RepID=A0ABN1RI70_9ACTN